MERANFKFHTQLRVRNYEVDWQGIVHNANYLLYFEVGRIEYLKRVGVAVSLEAIRNDARVDLVRNEINYLKPARFDALLNVHARISYIKNTSFAFEGMLEEASTGEVIAENVAVHVWLDPRDGSPTRIGDDFREIIRKFEGNAAAILEGPGLA
jgi:acyl-CoA thioester hydrolase